MSTRQLGNRHWRHRLLASAVVAEMGPDHLAIIAMGHHHFAAGFSLTGEMKP
ncbi:MAG TPA: hypothetical protein VMW38_25120 [Terriglobia bacterium]|nr:hypothetical protein [Terriglobia bacterium]